MASPEAIRFPASRNNSCPCRLMAGVAATLTRHLGFGRLPEVRPRFPQKRRQRNVGFVLKIQDSAVFFDGSANYGSLVPQPSLSSGLVDLVVFHVRTSDR